MEVIINATANEIADLVLALQGQRKVDRGIYGNEHCQIDIIRESVRQAIGGIAGARPET